MNETLMRLLFFIIIISAGTTVNSEGLFSWLFSSGKKIIAEIKLVNKCQLDSKYFIVRDLESGKSVSFTNGFAKLPTKTKSSVQLQLSPSVKNVTFAGNAVAAKKKMKLVADCSERNLKDVSKN
tara:strand:+ start:828 stop:1199 length:372 start_codon:yes stop_codon:yes gene_type:complete